MVCLSAAWQDFLKEEITQDYFTLLLQKTANEYKTSICFPPEDLIFEAFNSCTPNDLKIVILGQDPYHGNGEANGLSFSVSDGVKIPPSLRNIYREIATDLDSVFLPTTGNLVTWVAQGVLLLNASLTVKKDSPNSHKHLGWGKFTDAVIKTISEKNSSVVFMLWGAFAQKKATLIDASKHLILQSGHPSPMSANQGKWFGNKHFSQANTYLKSQNKTPIRWFLF